MTLWNIEADLLSLENLYETLKVDDLEPKPGQKVLRTQGYQSSPSQNFEGWTNVVVCMKCARVAHYDDEHPIEPCLDCGNVGSGMEGRIKRVGRWVEEYDLKTVFAPWYLYFLGFKTINKKVSKSFWELNVNSRDVLEWLAKNERR